MPENIRRGAEIVKHAWLDNKKFITRLILITNCEGNIKRYCTTQIDSLTFSKKKERESLRVFGRDYPVQYPAEHLDTVLAIADCSEQSDWLA